MRSLGTYAQKILFALVLKEVGKIYWLYWDCITMNRENPETRKYRMRQGTRRDKENNSFHAKEQPTIRFPTMANTCFVCAVYQRRSKRCFLGKIIQLKAILMHLCMIRMRDRCLTTHTIINRFKQKPAES